MSILPKACKLGYKNLMYLSSQGYLKGFYYNPRINWELLKRHSVRVNML